MLKKVFLTTVVLFLTSCGCNNIPYEYDEYYTPLIERFKLEAQQENIELGNFDNITVWKVVDQLPSTQLSECVIHTVKRNYKYIHYREIKTLKSLRYETYDYKYKLFLHEVGHCAYHLMHNSDKSDIMYYLVYRPSNFHQQLYNFFKQAKANKYDWFSNDNLE